MSRLALKTNAAIRVKEIEKPSMSARYVVQRDRDATWSVREIASNNPAILKGALQVGLTEDLAAIRTKKLNSHIIEADNCSSKFGKAGESLVVNAH